MNATDTIDLEVVTPERLVLKVDANEVVLPGLEGYFGVLPGHAPLLSVLGAGELSYRVGSEWGYLAVAGGFVEVLRGSVGVLAETAELPDEIDEARARRDVEEAEAAQRTETSESGQRRAQEKLDRALARLKVRTRA